MYYYSCTILHWFTPKSCCLQGHHNLSCIIPLRPCFIASTVRALHHYFLSSSNSDFFCYKSGCFISNHTSIHAHYISSYTSRLFVFIFTKAMSSSLSSTTNHTQPIPVMNLERSVLSTSLPTAVGASAFITEPRNEVSTSMFAQVCHQNTQTCTKVVRVGFRCILYTYTCVHGTWQT